MRRISLSELKPEMFLARSVYHFNHLLLRQGARDLTKYVDSLFKLGIFYVYVEDALSEDIEIPDAITEETRFKCKDALQDTFNHFQKEGSFDTARISDVIDNLLEEILSRPDVLLSLNDLGTTDDSTLVHSVNTTVLSLLLAEQLGMSPFELKKLGEGTILHDIGKTVLKSTILYKPSSLDEEELEHVKLHTVYGYKILKKNPIMTELSRLIALQHHERLDGSGYPNGLVKEEIHLFSKIAAIADMYDALTAERCYRGSLTNYEAYQILMEDSAIRLDAELLGKFLQKIAVYPNGTMVKLSDGTRGIVKAQNESMPFRPIIRVIDDFRGSMVKLYDLDLMTTLNITIITD